MILVKIGFTGVCVSVQNPDPSFGVVFMPRLEASRPRLVCLSVCRSVCLSVFKTSFAMKLPSKQGLLSKQVLL